MGLAFAGWLALGVREVPDGSVGVRTGFGAPLRVLGPGLHVGLPPPLQEVHTVSTREIKDLAVGDEDGGLTTLTRDGAPVILAGEVKWRVSDPQRYTLAAATPEKLLRDDARSALRAAISTRTLADLAGDTAGAARDAATQLQAQLDRERLGIEASDLEITSRTPPEGARDGLVAVAAARAEAGAARREAELYRDRVLAQAHGEAEAGLQAAQAVRDREVAEAEGEAERFALVDGAYRKAPEVTRERLYAETMARVLHDVPKVILPSAKSSAQTLSPDLFRPSAAEGRDAPSPSVPHTGQQP